MPSVQTYTSRAKWEEIKKGYKKVKMSKQHEQWHMKEISHCGVKFSTSSFSSSAPSFLMIMISNVQFDSNSSCLDRLNNLGINILQKL